MIHFGRVEPKGKLHIAMTANRMTCCDHTLRTTETVAGDVAEGLEGTIATLLDLGVRPSRLCFNCFPIRTRKKLSDAYKTARAGR